MAAKRTKPRSTASAPAPTTETPSSIETQGA